MNPQEKGTALSLIVLCATVSIIIVFAALWEYRALVALCLLLLGVLTALVLLGLLVAHRLNEMNLRHHRYHHQEETPLDAAGYPTLLQPGQQPYYAAMQRRAGVPHDERGRYE